MEHDDVPKGLAVVVGHVCGVFAVGMALLGFVALAGGVARGSIATIAVGGGSLALATALFRWAGVMTGYWNVSGRLAVPRWIYHVLSGVFAALAILGVGLLILQPPQTLGDAFGSVTGIVSGAVLAWLCRLAMNRFS